MGVVYEAEQISLGRHVALKVLPFASMLDPRHYAMQFIEGESLASIIEQVRGRAVVRDRESDGGGQESRAPDTGPSDARCPDTQRPSPDTSPIAALSTLPESNSREYFRAVARLGIQAAEALDHAHELGVIHRDIKPANLLLDETGRLWITDFGLARLESDAGVTMTGDVLGTLRYMSPEQALAKRIVVDHRTDIYSLGATLYELLTLQPVFDGDDRQSLLRQISFDEPKPVRRLNQQIPVELETIVLKTLNKNPTERYATAKDLADDLRSFLDNKPIKAKPPTRLEQATKWSRRHPAVVWAVALVLLVTTIGSIASAVLIGNAYRREAAAAQRASESAAAERTAAAKAKQAAAKAKEAADAEKTQRRQAQLVTDFLVNAFRSPGPDRDGHTITVAEVLDRSVEEIKTKFAADPLVHAKLLDAIAWSYEGLGLYDKAIPLVEMLRDACTRDLGPSLTPTLKFTNRLVTAYLNAGRAAEALPLAEQTAKLCRAQFNATDSTRLQSITNLAHAHQAAGRIDEAIRFYNEALSAAKTVPGHPDTAALTENLGQAYRIAGRFDEAVTLLNETFELSKAEHGADHQRTLESMNNLAIAQFSAGHLELAVPMLEEVLKLRKFKLGPVHPDTLGSMSNLGVAYKDANRIDDAMPLLEEALRLGKANEGAENPNTLDKMQNLAGAYESAGRMHDFIALVEETVKLRRRKQGGEHPTTLKLMNDLAGAYRSVGRVDDAIALIEDILKFRREKLGIEHPELLDAITDLAELYLTANPPKAVEAERLSRECLAIYAKKSPDDWSTFFTRMSLGTALLLQEKYAAAEPLLLEGYEGMQQRIDQIPSDCKPFVNEAAQRLVLLYENMKQPEKAAKWKEKLAELNKAPPVEQ